MILLAEIRKNFYSSGVFNYGDYSKTQFLKCDEYISIVDFMLIKLAKYFIPE